MTNSSKQDSAQASTAEVPAPARLVIEDEVAWIHLDDPEKKVNTLSTRYFEWFETQIDRLADEPVRGLVLISDKPGYFIVGADIEELQAFADPREVHEMVMRGHDLVGRFKDLPFPVVAAIDGACLGGGLELSMACDLRVATDAPHTKLGLPEVQLGLFPGLGGTQRLPRLVGVPDGLDLILTGKQVSAKKAKRIGLVDAICHPLVLKQAALALVDLGKPGTEGYRGPSRKSIKGGMAKKAANFLARTRGVNRLVYDKARETVMKKSGGHYPAPLKAIEVVKEGMGLPLDKALEVEADGFAELVVTDVAKGLISIFFTKNEVDGRAAALAKNARELERIGVLGAGFMGSGVAQVLAHKGYEILMKDRNHEAVGRGMKHCSDLFGKLVKRRKYKPVEKKLAMSRILPRVDYRGFERVPFVIEAVFEDVEVKHQVIREAEEAGPDDMIFASNTSTIPITRLAEASKRPENMIGMHFFSPVHKMPLIEIIKTKDTSDETLATTVEVGRRMGKTIIVVNDGPGFFTSRVLGPFINEAMWCLSQGASIEQIDRALTGWGWPVGPMALLDEVGLDIALHAGEIVAEYAGDRADTSPYFQRMIDGGRLGRKSKRGFYDYSKKPKKVDRSVYEMLGWQESRIDDLEIIERCWMQMLNETARCIEDGIIENPNDIDIGVIFGFGFPPFRGGILREADKQGLDYVVARLEDYAEAYGDRLAPTQLLQDMAHGGKTFHKYGD